MYLADGLEEELDLLYKQENARHVMEGKPEIEKHRHFFEAIMWAGMNSDDLDEYIESMYERYS